MNYSRVEFRFLLRADYFRELMGAVFDVRYGATSGLIS